MNARHMYCRESDHCGWSGGLTKPWRAETNTLFNTPDVERDGSNVV